MFDCKTVLLAVGAVVALMGILGIMPSLGVNLGPLSLGTEPMWHAALKIVIGIFAVRVAMSQK